MKQGCVIAAVAVSALALPACSGARSAFDPRLIAEAPAHALLYYLHEQVADFMSYSNGGASGPGGVNQLSFYTGIRWSAEGTEIRSVCGVIITGESLTPEDELAFQAVCETRLLHGIKWLSQSEPGPHKAAGAGAIAWTTRLDTLATSDVVFVMQGTYFDTRTFRPCRFRRDCCSLNGMRYLDSCREPSDLEWEGIYECQSVGLGGTAPEYLGCLREQGIVVGCDDLPDGSRWCY